MAAAAEEEDAAAVASNDLAQQRLLNSNLQKLQRLQQNESTDFRIREYDDRCVDTFAADWWGQHDEYWNLLFTELLKNTSLENVNVALKYCRPVESLILLVKYISTSPKLKKLTIHYDLHDDNHDDTEYQHQHQQIIPKSYRSKINDILLAVRQNPAIQMLKLHCLGNRQSMQHFLSGNTSLTSFELELNNNHQRVSKAMATCIATGLQHNKMLQNIVLIVCKGHLDIVLSGLCHRRRRRDDDGDDDDDSMSSSPLQSLTISHRFEYPNRNSQLGLRVFEAIQCNPSLKKLVIQGSSPYSSSPFSLEDHGVFPRRSWVVGDVLKKLHHTDCAGLEILQLQGIGIGTNQHDDDYDDDESMMAADWIIPAEQANWTLKDLFLVNVRFGTKLSVRLLWNLRGIKRLHIEEMEYPDKEDDYAESDHDDDDSDDEENEGEVMSNLSGEMGDEEEGGSDENSRDEAEKDGANQSFQGDEHNGVEEKQADIDENNGSENDCKNDEADQAIQDNGNGGAKAKEAGVDENSGSGDHDNNVGTEQEQAQGNEIVDNVGVQEEKEVVDNCANAGGADPDYWAQFIRQCTELDQVYIGDAYYDLYASVLSGACGHANLQELILKWRHPVEMPGEQAQSLFQQLLRETPSLRTLHLDCIGPEQDLAAGLASGLRGNESLQQLVVMMNRMQASNYCTILESLFDNQTLLYFGNTASYDDDEDSWYDDPYESHTSQEICGTLSRMFLVNKSLYHIALPLLDLRGHMNGLLEALGQTPTLRSLDCGNLQTDAVGVAALQQALVHNANIHLEHIVLPDIGDVDVFKDFLRSISQIWSIKTVDLVHNGWYLSNEMKLLLRGAQQNKTITSFGTFLNSYCCPTVSEIRYYLKLNRFGRHGLDSTNLRLSLWPAILVPMAGKSEDADALFFFIREYFMRHSYPLRYQHQRQAPCTPAPKRARVDQKV